MKTTALWTLFVVNVLLLVALVARQGSSAWSTAIAQPQQQQPARAARPGDYLMIPGDVTGASNTIVYIVDMTNGRLGAMTYNESRTRLEAMPSIDLNAIFQRAAQGGQVAPGRPGR